MAEKMINQTGRCRIFIPVIFFLILLLCSGSVFADPETDAGFSELIGRFKESGSIPDSEGKIYALGNFENSLAMLGYSAMTPLMEADNFVISVKMSYTSSIATPTLSASGCGIYFNASDSITDHMMVSLRMDGTVTLSGSRYYTSLKYPGYLYTAPAVNGGAELTLIVTGRNAEIYVNGERCLRYQDLPVAGSILGLAVLSGSYQDFGTNCIFENIYIYTWE